MASYNDHYYDTYGPRPSARRHHSSSNTRPQDPYYSSSLNVGPAAGRPDRGRGSSHQTGGENDRHDSRQQGNRSTATTATSYGLADHRSTYPPPPPPPDTGRPQRPPPSPSRRRHAWPPSPTCEDERTSLAREANSRKLLQELAKSEVPSRGTIDQDPIIQEVPELINRDERRFVVVSESDKASRSSGVLTPPTSEDERARRVKRRPSRLNTDLKPDVPEQSRRTASPYSITKPTKLPQITSQNDRFLSPEALTPPATDLGRRRDGVYSRSKPPSPRRDSARHSPSTRKGNDYFSARHTRSDNAIDDDDRTESAASSRRTSARSATSNARTATQDFAPSQPTYPPQVRRLGSDARRNTDTSTTLPRVEVDKKRRPPSLVSASTIDSSANTLRAGDLFVPRTREGSHASSRPISPASARSLASASPPRSPRRSADFSSSQRSAERSPASRPGSGSGSGSRPSSPVPRMPGDSPRLPRADVDWNILLAANAKRRSKPPSRLTSSMRQESLPDIHNSSTKPVMISRPFEGLPYPEDDGPGTPSAYMPAEHQYQFYPQASRDADMRSTYDSRLTARASSPARSNVSRRSDRASRPSLPTRHSVATVSPTEERPHPVPRTNSFSTTTETRRELVALAKKGLPSCPRPDLVAGHDEWYTVIGAPGLDFCPDCVSAVFERTIFMPGIRHSPPRSLDTRIQCAFGSSTWIRLAWLLTLKQRRTDFTLLRYISEIEEQIGPCPGRRAAVRTWYGLKDSEGSRVRNFHICESDVRKIECLLPTLTGLFVPWPHRASYEEEQCATHEGNRFSAYLNTLISMHDDAAATRQIPDPTAFVQLHRHKSQLRECQKDKRLSSGLWHYIDWLQPALTVCEDCYEAIVEPEIEKGSEVAKSFNRSLQPVYTEGKGCSCQLYSPRMRKVFARAVKEDDFRYLARKGSERRKKEVELNGEIEMLERHFRRISRDGMSNGVSESERRRFEYEKQAFVDEWVEKWE